MTLKENDKSKGICDECKLIVNTTAVPREFKKFKMLVFVCDECSNIVGIPHSEIKLMDS